MKRTSWVSLLLLVVLLAACGGPAVQPSTGATRGGEGVFQIALPRLVIDVDSQGNPSIMNMSPALLKAFGVDTSGFQVPPQLVETLTKADIQHIEIASVGDRLVLFANGQPLPHLGWTQESLNQALKLATALNVQNAEMLNKLLPLITRLGLDVVLRFPVQSGAAAIPMTEAGAAKSLQVSPSTDAASIIARLEITFDENGAPGLMGLSAQDLMGVASLPQLSPDLIQKLQGGNIQHLELRTKPDGTYIYANDAVLPTLIWDTKLLANLVAVYAKVAPDNSLLPLIQNIVPYLDRADVDIMLHFPVAAGAAPLPVKMHE